MLRKDLIKIASKAYPDDLVQLAYDNRESPGDTLALFVSNELRAIFDPAADAVTNLRWAAAAMTIAKKTLDDVSKALSAEADKREAAHEKESES